MKLAKHEMAWISNSRTHGENKRVFQFRITGLPAGQEAFIAEFPHKGWKILRSVNQVQDHWSGKYQSVDRALKILQRLVTGKTKVKLTCHNCQMSSNFNRRHSTGKCPLCEYRFTTEQLREAIAKAVALRLQGRRYQFPHIELDETAE